MGRKLGIFELFCSGPCVYDGGMSNADVSVACVWNCFKCFSVVLLFGGGPQQPSSNPQLDAGAKRHPPHKYNAREIVRRFSLSDAFSPQFTTERVTLFKANARVSLMVAGISPCSVCIILNERVMYCVCVCVKKNVSRHVSIIAHRTANHTTPRRPPPRASLSCIRCDAMRNGRARAHASSALCGRERCVRHIWR